MDRITHQVRLANWTEIIEQCKNRPAVITAKQWLRDNGISDKSYYYWLRKIRQYRNYGDRHIKHDILYPVIPSFGGDSLCSLKQAV